ncbi:hypothetical protein [Maridesulfovibrio ferrireducens]|uniref:hypothetical protein n=1 Tax=Maridesulfovibrio ferrireducens TaxID=246191 RepID=UPI001A2DBBB5|nr:hypothetical protein [Maridesulfovibrio ferrireducens]MBI9112944.1 hypothetical protein [Maridesulfovibrio ferrireducens]
MHNVVQLNPEKSTSGDPVIDIFAAVSSLELLTATYRALDREGDANILELLSRQIRNAVEIMDEDNWKAEEVCNA